jgi:hypothetical protein
VVLAATFELVDLVEILVVLALPAALIAAAIFFRGDRKSGSSETEPDTP